MTVVEQLAGWTGAGGRRPQPQACLEVRDLKVHFPVTRGLLRRGRRQR